MKPENFYINSMVGTVQDTGARSLETRVFLFQFNGFFCLIAHNHCKDSYMFKMGKNCKCIRQIPNRIVITIHYHRAIDC